MACYSLNTILRPADPLRLRLSAIIPGIWGFKGIGLAGFQPSPQRPRPTFLKYLILCALLILCFPGSSQSVESAHISKQLLTTSSMTCMELEKVLNRSYLDQGCSPIDMVSGPTSYIRVWQCPWKRYELVSIQFSEPVDTDQYCLVRSDTCKLVGMDANVGWYVRRYYHRETCRSAK